MIVTFLDELADTLSRAEASAYERGKDDGIREVLDELTSITKAKQRAPRQDTEPQPPRSAAIETVSTRPASDRKRAPKGTVRGLINRVLLLSPGLKPMEIIELAETDYEKMVHTTSLRNQLRRGLKQGQYLCAHSRWYLAGPKTDEPEGTPATEFPSGSNNSKGGPYGTAIALDDPTEL